MRATTDRRDVAIERRRDGPAIADRETAADIDDIDGNPGSGDRRRGQPHRGGIGPGVKALRADMKGDAEPGGMRARGPQQTGRLCDRDAKLAREVIGAALADSEAHEQPQGRRRADQPDRHCFLQDFRQLVCAVEREIGHPVLGEGGMDRAAPLDRVHKMHRGVGQHAAHHRDLGQRGAIEMAHSAGPHRAQHARLRVALDGIEDIAGEHPDKAPRRGGDRRRTQAQQRLRRALARHDGIDRGENAGPCRTPNGLQSDKTNFRHRTILPGQGGDTGGADCARGAVTGQGEWRRRSEYAPQRQTIVRGFRIACRTIAVSLKDAGPQLAGSAERDALRRSSTPGGKLGF